jgi:pyruvate dehydrogenase (quinone)/pyruvate oxidase
MSDCDTLLIVGSTLPYIEFYPDPGEARCVQIDIDPTRIGLRYPAEVGLVGDAQRTLNALLPLLKKKSKSFLEKAQRGMKEWNQLLETRGTATADPMKPQVVGYELGKQIPPNAIVTSDSGTNTTWWARYVPSLKGAMHTCSGNLATMACGLSYAIGAQIAFPERPVIAFVGDGGFTMLMGELATCVKYQLPIKLFVIKNDELGQIKWEQMVFLGNPEYVTGLQPIDFAAVARAFGVTSYTIRTQAEAAGVIASALAAPGPVLVEAIVDANEPPLPARVQAKQALHLAESLAKGTKDWQKIARTVAKDKIRELV